MTETTDIIERPVPAGADEGCWGSDALAELLRALGIRYVALNPGASFRGLHDSLVNRLGNRDPRMLLCLHEEHAVAIAHGYAKVAGEPMAVILHANIGLMHGTMAIYNAWCDRVPMLVLGATGPVDAARRRPWIDWIHTARDQGALVRPYVKWDDQPASVPAAVESLLRANIHMRTAPHGPVYVCLDSAVQEQRLDAMPALPDVGRFRPPVPAAVSAQAAETAATWLRGAKQSVILAGRVSRRPQDWARRVALAEALGARVLTDIKTAAAFPTDHTLHCGNPGYFLEASAAEALRTADVVLSLDWVDLAGTLQQAGAARTAKVIHASLDHQLHNGWSMDHQGLPPVDLHLAAEPDAAMHAIADVLGVNAGVPPQDLPARPAAEPARGTDELDVRALAGGLGRALAGERVSIVRLPLSWSGDLWHFRHPLDYLGFDGGGGLASGPAMLIGAALALKGSGRIPLAIIGDGDTLMGINALWTGAHYGIPFLAVVANNRSFYNDEIHQERVARERGRPVENKWIGQHIGQPDIDIAAMARAQGLHGFGPAHTAEELSAALAQALPIVKAGGSAVIDARVRPGYSPSMTGGLTRAKG